MNAWWLVCAGVLILAVLTVLRAHIGLSAEVDRMEAAWRSTVELAERAADVRQTIEATRIDAAVRRDRLTARTASPSANRLRADH